jgi:hypothetical protein
MYRRTCCRTKHTYHICICTVPERLHLDKCTTTPQFPVSGPHKNGSIFSINGHTIKGDLDSGWPQEVLPRYNEFVNCDETPELYCVPDSIPKLWTIVL